MQSCKPIGNIKSTIKKTATELWNLKKKIEIMQDFKN